MKRKQAAASAKAAPAADLMDFNQPTAAPSVASPAAGGGSGDLLSLDGPTQSTGRAAAPVAAANPADGGLLDLGFGCPASAAAATAPASGLGGGGLLDLSGLTAALPVAAGPRAAAMPAAAAAPPPAPAAA